MTLPGEGELILTTVPLDETILSLGEEDGPQAVEALSLDNQSVL